MVGGFALAPVNVPTFHLINRQLGIEKKLQKKQLSDSTKIDVGI